MCEKPPPRRCQKRPLIRKIKCPKKTAEEEEYVQTKCIRKCEKPKCVQECKQPKCVQECKQPKCIQECPQPKCIQECPQPKCKQQCVQTECVQECPETKCIQECVHTDKREDQQEVGTQKCVHTEELEEQQECGQAESIKFRLADMSTKPNAIEFEIVGMDSEECLYTVNESQEFRVTSSISTAGVGSRTGPEPGFSAGEFFHKILDILRILKSWTRDQCRKVQNAVTPRQGPQVYYFPCTNDYV